MNIKTMLAAVLGAIGLSACAAHPPLAVVSKVETEKFMGRWYVIAHIPTWVERKAFNAIEAYELNKDGTIATTFTFNEGKATGPLKVYHPKGFVVDGTGNAIWGMQFIWPIKAQYKITYLAPDYSSTIVARDALDYVWIMARSPNISDEEYATLRERVASYGYDLSQLRRVPHAPRQ